MIFSIHQPCYFPWLGLLSKIARSDALIILDEVQLSDSAFQHRNQFLTTDGKVKYLTIPFVKKDYLGKPFRELQIADPGWSGKHSNFLRNNYKKHPFFDQIYPALEPLFIKQTPYLLEVVLDSMQTSMRLCGIETKVLLQSQIRYNREAKKGDLVMELLQATKAEEYLSGCGAQAYQDDSVYAAQGIALHYLEFTHPTYSQRNSSQFIPGLSCLDLLFNVGCKEAGELFKGHPLL